MYIFPNQQDSELPVESLRKSEQIDLLDGQVIQRLSWNWAPKFALINCTTCYVWNMRKKKNFSSKFFLWYSNLRRKTRERFFLVPKCLYFQSNKLKNFRSKVEENQKKSNYRLFQRLSWNLTQKFVLINSTTVSRFNFQIKSFQSWKTTK